MSEKNWPEPTRLFFNWDNFAWQSHGRDLYTPDSYEKKDLEVHTAAQVREIVAAEVAAVRAELEEDAERYKFAVAPGAGGSMNWLDVYEAWNGDGDLTAAIDAARAAKGGE